MDLLRTKRYRLHPTKDQARRLEAWSNSCRILWNVANEQRIFALNNPRPAVSDTRPGQPRIDYFSQCRQLTAVRNEAKILRTQPDVDPADLRFYEGFADAPCRIHQATLENLEKAWKRCFQKLGGKPKFKRYGEFLSLFFMNSDIDLGETEVRLPKIGNIKLSGCIKADGTKRQIDGELRNVRIQKDVDRWEIIVLFRQTIPEPTPIVEPVVAIRRGVVYSLADSNGVTVESPAFYEKALDKLARAQRHLEKKRAASPRDEHGRKSKRLLKREQRVAKIHRRVRLQRDAFNHKLSKDYAAQAGTILVADFNTVEMIVDGASKGNLARRISDQGWGDLILKTEYKIAARGGSLQKQLPEYSSQTCSMCGVVDPASRKGQTFHCTSCHGELPLSVNAARVVFHRRDEESMKVQPAKKKKIALSRRKKKDTNPNPATTATGT